MAGISVIVVVVVAFLHILAFVLAIGAEMRRSTGKVVPDEYDERTFCAYDSDASTAYGLSAFGLLLLSQAVVSAATRCLCFGRGLSAGGPRTCAIASFVVSWMVTDDGATGVDGGGHLPLVLDVEQSFPSASLTASLLLPLRLPPSSSSSSPPLPSASSTFTTFLATILSIASPEKMKKVSSLSELNFVDKKSPALLFNFFINRSHHFVVGLGTPRILLKFSHQPPLR